MFMMCLLAFLGGGCAYREYKEHRVLRTVDTQARSGHSSSSPKIYFERDDRGFLVVDVKKETVEQLQERDKVMYERCWEVRRHDVPDNPIEFLFFLGIEVPFVILQAVLQLVPEPGCNTWTEWADWKYTDKSRTSSMPCPGKVFLDCGPAGRYELLTDKLGKARLNMSPLLNHLTRGRKWTISAKALCDGVSVIDSIKLDTTKLGVTWDTPRTQPDFPAHLIVSVKFVDHNGNNILDDRETAYLVVTITNNGRGDAFEVDVIPRLEEKANGVVLRPAKGSRIKWIPKGRSQECIFRLTAKEEVPAQPLVIRMSIKELNGFEPLPLKVILATRPL